MPTQLGTSSAQVQMNWMGTISMCNSQTLMGLVHGVWTVLVLFFLKKAMCIPLLLQCEATRDKRREPQTSRHFAAEKGIF